MFIGNKEFNNIKEANQAIDQHWDHLLSQGIYISPKANNIDEARNLIKALITISKYKVHDNLSINEFIKLRNKRWVEASHKSLNFTNIKETCCVIQQLGNIDIQLITCENQNFKERADLIMGLSYHLTTSYLWVLGAYEIIRNLHSKISDPELSDKFKKLKHKISRLRMPLAKLEAANQNKNDYPFAWPGLQQELGVCWQINDNKIEGQACSSDTVGIISRRELADQFLTLLSEIN